MGDLLEDAFYADLERDQAERATMSMLIPPQMVNTMVPATSLAPPSAAGAAFTAAFHADPVRRYMLPVFSDRHPVWPSHPYASRDSLHEHDMWVAEGLTHRYPTKVLAEAAAHLPAVLRALHPDGPGRQLHPGRGQAEVPAQAGGPARADDRLPAPHPGVRDVVVSGGDVANMPWKNLETFLNRLLEIDSIRDIRLATKALMGLPQHWLQPDVVDGSDPGGRTARRRGVNLAVHTHVNAAQSVTPLVAEATKAMLEAGRARRAQPGRADAWRERRASRHCSTCASPCRTAR